MLEERRYLAARDRLRQLQAGNRRVYGLDLQLAHTEQTIARVEGLLTRADDALRADDATEAVQFLKKAAALIADHPEVAAKLAEAERRAAEAAKLFAEAKQRYDANAWEEALQLVQRSLAINANHPPAQRLRDELRTALALEHGDKRKLTWSVMLGGAAAILLVVVLGIWLAAYKVQQSRDAARQATIGEAQRLLASGQLLIKEEKFREAQDTLLQAQRKLGELSTPEKDLAASIQRTLSSEPLTKGMAGQVQFEGRWVSLNERAKIAEARQKLPDEANALISLLRGRINGTLPPESPALSNEQRQEYEALIAPLERVVQLARDRRFTEAEAILNESRPKIDTLLTDLGLVRYGDAWMTREAAADREMIDKGFVRVDGQWISKAERERRENIAKGMIETNGTWKLPTRAEEERMARMGMVKHDGRWVGRHVKEQAERAAGKTAPAAESPSLPIARDEPEQADDEATAKLRENAYKISHTFVWRAWPETDMKKFPAYGGADVSVKPSPTRGRFIVKAHAIGREGNTTRRRGYTVEVWPVDAEGKRWLGNEPVFED